VGDFFFKTPKGGNDILWELLLDSIKHTRCCGELRDGLKRNAGPGEPCGMKHVTFLDFLLLFYQEKSKRKQIRGSSLNYQSRNLTGSNSLNFMS